MWLCTSFTSVYNILGLSMHDCAYVMNEIDTLSSTVPMSRGYLSSLSSFILATCLAAMELRTCKLASPILTPVTEECVTIWGGKQLISNY